MNVLAIPVLLPAILFVLPVSGPRPIQDKKQDKSQATTQYKKRTVEDLLEVVGPFALYPDGLIRYILPASTHPDDVIAALAILKKSNDKADDRDPAVKKLDPSVQALLPFPDVVKMLAEYPDWMSELGDAVAYQEADVMTAIQEFRKKAHEAGNLETTKEQKVIVEKEVIRIVQADPEVIYVLAGARTRGCRDVAQGSR